MQSTKALLSPDIVSSILAFLCGSDQALFLAATTTIPPCTLLAGCFRDTDVARVTAAAWLLARRSPTDTRFDISSKCFGEDHSGLLSAIQACRPTFINLSNSTLGWASLDALAQCDGLEDLVVTDSFISQPPCRPWAFAQSLRRLNVCGTRLPPDWTALAFEGLEEYAGTVTPAIVASLAAGCPRLRRLTLHCVRVCELRMDGRSWLRLLAQLEGLRFERCDLLPRAHLLQDAGAVLQVTLTLPCMR